MVNPEREVALKPGLAGDGLERPLNTGERVIRLILLIGFVVVLAIEAWLLWQVWRFWA